MFPVDFFFLGGRLAVDLLNTVIVPDGRVRDLLSRRVDVASWGEAAGVVVRRDLRNAARGPAGLRAFREALRRGLVGGPGTHQLAWPFAESCFSWPSRAALAGCDKLIGTASLQH